MTTSISKTRENMERDYEFRYFIINFSKCFCGEKHRELKFLLSDILSYSKLSKCASAMTFLNALVTEGHISSGNVDLLSEIAKLTNNKPAKLCINEYMKVICDHAASGGTSLSLYRRTLYSCLCQVHEDASGDEQSDIQRLIKNYNLGHFDLKNKWDVVFFLEKQNKLKFNNIDALDRFTSCLNINAKNILKSFYSSKEQLDANKTTSPTERLEMEEAIEQSSEPTGFLYLLAYMLSLLLNRLLLYAGRKAPGLQAKLKSIFWIMAIVLIVVSVMPTFDSINRKDVNLQSLRNSTVKYDKIGNKLIITELIDSNGGVLEIAESGIKLIIPPGAINEGTQINISLAQLLYTKSSFNTTLIAPAVECGPPATVFKKPVTLIISHDAVDKDEWDFSYYVKNSTADPWTKFDNKNTSFIVEDGRFVITTNHFCIFEASCSSRSDDSPLKYTVCTYGKMLATKKYYLLRVRIWRLKHDTIITMEEEDLKMKKLSVYEYMYLKRYQEVAIKVINISDGWTEKGETKLIQGKDVDNSPYVFKLEPDASLYLQDLELLVHISQGNKSIAVINPSYEIVIEGVEQPWVSTCLIIAFIIGVNIYLVETAPEDERRVIFTCIKKITQKGLSLGITIYSLIVIFITWFYIYCPVSDESKLAISVACIVIFYVGNGFTSIDPKINIGQIITVIPTIYSKYPIMFNAIFGKKEEEAQEI